MAIFDRSIDKNAVLKSTRGVSFEDIVSAINDGHLLATLTHPNSLKYPNQKVHIILVNDYVYTVPFVEKDGICFLKTIYPSRKYSKQYLQKEK